MYAYLVLIPSGEFCVGVQFASGYRCYYPHTASPDIDNADWHGIINAESGSYYCWDNFVGHPYEEF
jgi:hypothetical protein